MAFEPSNRDTQINSTSTNNSGLDLIKCKPIVIRVEVSLGDILTGTMYHETFKRTVEYLDEWHILEPVLVQFPIPRGMHHGMIIRFKNFGPKFIGYIQPDVIFVLKEKPHQTLSRLGNGVDLQCNVEISQQEMLKPFLVLKVEAPEGPVTIMTKSKKSPIVVNGLGLPSNRFDATRGKLFVNLLLVDHDIK